MMMQYLEARRQLTEILSRLDALREEVMEIMMPPGSESEQDQNELKVVVDRVADELQELIDRVQTEPNYCAVIGAEQPLQAAFDAAVQLWKTLIARGLVETDGQLGEVATPLPPIPPHEVTSESVMGFLREMHEWIDKASAELWQGEEIPFRRPTLGNRFFIGDFGQLRVITDALAVMPDVREHWLSISSTGEYWDSVNIGSSRARLLTMANAVVNSVVHSAQLEQG